MRPRASLLILLTFLLPLSALHADSAFSAKGCEYSVSFPSVPKYKSAYAPTLGDYTQAELLLSDSFVRAECIATGDLRNADINSKKFLLRQVAAYAESNGIQNAEYQYADGPLGKNVRVRGFKSLDGKPLTFEAYIYVGNRSFISLYAGGLSSTYPQKSVFAFLTSVRRK